MCQLAPDRRWNDDEHRKDPEQEPCERQTLNAAKESLDQILTWDYQRADSQCRGEYDTDGNVGAESLPFLKMPNQECAQE